MEKKAADIKQLLNNIRIIIQGIFATAAVCIIYGVQTSSILSFAVFAMSLLLTYKCRPQLEKKEKVVNILLSGLFSLLTALGELLVIIESEYTFSWAFTFLICWIGMYVIFELILGMLIQSLRNNYFFKKEVQKKEPKEQLRFFIVSLVILLFVWLTGWLRTYPGSMSRDSIQIASMALGNIELNAAVPIVYIMPIRLLWNIGVSLFGTANAGLAMCTFMQTVVCAVIVSYAVTRLYGNNIKKWVCMVVVLYFALMPYNAYMVTTIWKDVPFAASTLLFISLLFDLYLGEKAKNKVMEYSRLILFVVAGMGVCLMRNNGLYAFLLFIPFGIYVFWKKNKKAAVAILLILVFTRITQGPVYDSIMTDQARKVAQKDESVDENVDADTEKGNGKKVENATDSYNNSGIYIVTIQQLANVAVDRTDLSQEDYERLDKVIKVDEIREIYAEKSDYCRRCIDPVIGLRRYKASMAEYLETWVYFGLKYPINYLIGWRGQTWGYWYPDIQNWTTIDAIIENDLGVYKDSVLPDEVIWKIWDFDEIYMKIPGYGLIWSIGFVVWTTIFFMGMAYIRKGLKAAMLYIPLIGIWLTLLIATPIYAEFRYAYSIYWCLPLVMLFPFIEKKEENN